MNATVPDPLAPTGERTVPGLAREQYFFARHEAVYRWITREFAARLEGTVVVDAGSGEGYGAALLAAAGTNVTIALEYDDTACRHSSPTYSAIRVVQANLAALPLRPRSVDLVVSLQVIEHLWDLRGFLQQVSTALVPGGAFIASTPNRPVFSPGLGRGERPINPFHVEEFDDEQLRALMSDVARPQHEDFLFEESTIEVWGLHHGPRLLSWEADHGLIMDAQFSAMTEDSWSRDLEDFIAGIDADDFVISPDSAGAQDLIVIARTEQVERPERVGRPRR